MKKTRLRFKTLILSDVHLGTPDCRIDEVNDVLRHTECDKLILNGDIIDGWSLKRHGKRWTRGHTRFVRNVLKMVDKGKTELVYLRGNHDDVLRKILPLVLHRVRILEQHIHRGAKGRYLVVHGDVFDVITQHYRWLAKIGSLGYDALLRLNRWINRYRSWRNLEFFSLSKHVKSRVKNAVSYIGHYEEQLQELARRHGCVGVICGHIHAAADKQVGDIHYLNSGDWVESLTALVEHEDGEFEILDYPEFQRRWAARDRLRRQGDSVHLGAA